MTHLLLAILGIPAPMLLAVVGVLVFAEAAVFLGFVLPGETAVLMGGFLASTGHLGLLPLAVTAVVAAVAGDSVLPPRGHARTGRAEPDALPALPRLQRPRRPGVGYRHDPARLVVGIVLWRRSRSRSPQRADPTATTAQPAPALEGRDNRAR